MVSGCHVFSFFQIFNCNYISFIFPQSVDRELLIFLSFIFPIFPDLFESVADIRSVCGRH